MKWKKLVSVICIGVGLFFLTACKEERENWKPIGDDNTIKIAIIGDDEYIEDNGSMEAMELASDHFYKQTGIKIETVIYDDDADYNKGIVCAKEIATDENIAAVLVKQELDYIDATAEIFEEAYKPFVLTNGCYEHTINQEHKYMLVDCINAKSAGVIMGDWVIDHGYSRVAFCHSDTEYEEDELKGFHTQIANSSVRLVDTVVGPYTQEEFDVAYSRWDMLGVDVVCISNYDILNSDIVRMLRKKGSDICVVGDYVMDTDEDISANGEYLDGTAIVGMYINDYEQVDTEITDAFYEKYDLHMSEKAIQSYDIIRMIGEGLNSGISSPLELIDYMKREEGYEGVSGTLVFNEKGCLIPNGNEMLIFENGAFSQINNKE